MKAVRRLLVIVYLALFGLSAAASIMLLAVPISDSKWYLHADKGSYQLIDFSQFYQAGQLCLGKNSHQVYDPEVQNQWACALLAPNVPDKIFYNQSVPFLYVLLIPYGLLQYGQAYVTWCLSTLVAAAVALYLLVSRVGYLKGPARALFLAGVLASIPSYLTIWHGQTAYLLTAAFALTALFLMQKRALASGLCLALTTFKPQYLLSFIALLVGLGEKKTILALFLFEALLMAVASLFIGVENIVGYPRVLTVAESSSRFIGVNPHYMVSIRGLLSNLLPHKTAMLATVVMLFAALPPLAIFSARLSKRTAGGNSASQSSVLSRPADESRRWLISLTFVLALIVSPHSHYFDCLLLAVPAALTLPTLDLVALISKNGPAAELSPCYRMWCLILVLYPLVSWPINFMPKLIPGGSREIEGMVFLAINLALFFLAIFHLKSSALKSA